VGGRVVTELEPDDDEYFDLEHDDVLIGLVIIAFLVAIVVATFFFAPAIEDAVRRAF
jgi:hypothetical protein